MLDRGPGSPEKVVVRPARYWSRRALLAVPALATVAGVGLAGGCASDADRINNLVFGAVRKDPLYLWRPEWATTVSDFEFPAGRIANTSVPRMNHDITAEDLPSTAVAEAIRTALESGWQVGCDTFSYLKPIRGSDMTLAVDFATSIELKLLTMRSSGGKA